METTQENGAGAAAGAPAEAEVNVTVEQWLAMSEEERGQLPKARQKKLAKQAEVLRKKAAKASVAPTQKTAAAPADAAGEAKKRAKKKSAKATEEDLRDDTPKGEKKIIKDMLSAYYPKYVESAWGEWWEASGFFKADVQKGLEAGPDDKFVMVIPPPNVTGTLHIGHALTSAIEDTLTRWHRMCGRVTLWVPGVDHAGIATQVVVEKKIQRERGLSRHDLGREAFVEEVWKYKEEYGGKIQKQLRRMGISADWSREQFTLSDQLSRAVKEAFVRLFDRNLIYRDTRLVNWCCKLRTAISDIEVNYIDIPGRMMQKVPGHDEEVEFGMLTQFAYRVDGSDEELVVATTRLETMLGDVAVAVHPKDPRYQHLIGKHLSHPFVDRKLVVIADDVLVDMEFGTGAVKITPAHDPNDFACGRRHKLPEITILTDEGLMNAQCGEFAGMPRYVARVEVEKALEAKGLLRGKTENPMRLGLCSRTGDVVEPLLKPQWWVDCSEMAKRSTDATRAGDLKFVPELFEPTWFGWLDNIRDWCISRQLWWGHRIPAYSATTADGREVWTVGRSDDEARAKASKELGCDPQELTLAQDEDVLDTWFSSGLFPFSVFGWPEQTDELKAFYPTALLETGHDIIFFWVARMVMLGLTLTDSLPFKTVFLHAMVRDRHGRKMSKSLGNVIDPLELIQGCTLADLTGKLSGSNLDPAEVEKAKQGMESEYPTGIPECGADALRCGLLAYTQQARDINLDIQRVVGYRNFCNKLWNATRFALGNLGADFVFRPEGLDAAIAAGSPADLYILNCLNVASRDANVAMEKYEFATLVTALYNFWLHELCDVYLEAIKPVVNGADEGTKSAALHVLYHCLHAGLRLLHPIMPFVTEELFQRLPNRMSSDPIESICISPYPRYSEDRTFDGAAAMMEEALAATRAARSLRATYDLKPSAKPEMYLLARGDQAFASASATSPVFGTLTGASTVKVVRDVAEIPAGCGVNVVNQSLEVHIALAGLVDFESELAKLRGSAEEKRLLIEGYTKKMSSPDYEKVVPANVREKNTATMEKYQQELGTITDLIARFEELMQS